MCTRFKRPRFGMTLRTLFLTFVYYWVVTVPASAACFFPSRLASQNIAYRYAIAFIDSLLNADDGVNRSQKASWVLQGLGRDRSTILADLTEALKELELAARSFECAASAIRPQEKFPRDRSSEFAQEQSAIARKGASAAGVIYLQLAEETRTMAALFVDSLKGSLNQLDFASRVAQVSASREEKLRELFQLSTVVSHVLIDANPNSSGRMSRLRITANERDDLVRIINTGFGDRAHGPMREAPAIDAAVRMFRDWLTTSGHTPRR